MLFIIENKNLRLNIVLNTDIQTEAINKERYSELKRRKKLYGIESFCDEVIALT